MIILIPYIIAFIVVGFLLFLIHRLSVANGDLKSQLRHVDNRLDEHIRAYNKRIRYQNNPELEVEDRRLAKSRQEMMMGVSEKDILLGRNPELLRNSDAAKKIQ